MITLSDNQAWVNLVTYLGNGSYGVGCQVLSKWCSDHGYTETRSIGGAGNYTSVKDTAALMNNFYNDVHVGSARILDLMTQQTRRWKLPAGLPKDAVKNGNKTGELNDTENDVLIVWAKIPYSISVQTTGISNHAHTFKTMKKMSAAMYTLFNE